MAGIDDVEEANAAPSVPATYHPLGSRARYMADEELQRRREYTLAHRRQERLRAQCTFQPAITKRKPHRACHYTQLRKPEPSSRLSRSPSPHFPHNTSDKHAGNNSNECHTSDNTNTAYSKSTCELRVAHVYHEDDSSETSDKPGDGECALRHATTSSPRTSNRSHGLEQHGMRGDVYSRLARHAQEHEARRVYRVEQKQRNEAAELQSAFKPAINRYTSFTMHGRQRRYEKICAQPSDTLLSDMHLDNCTNRNNKSNKSRSNSSNAMVQTHVGKVDAFRSTASAVLTVEERLLHDSKASAHLSPSSVYRINQLSSPSTTLYRLPVNDRSTAAAAAITALTAKRPGPTHSRAERQAAQRAFHERNRLLLQKRELARVRAEQATLAQLRFHPVIDPMSAAIEAHRAQGARKAPDKCTDDASDANTATNDAATMHEPAESLHHTVQEGYESDDHVSHDAMPQNGRIHRIDRHTQLYIDAMHKRQKQKDRQLLVHDSVPYTSTEQKRSTNTLHHPCINPLSRLWIAHSEAHGALFASGDFVARQAHYAALHHEQHRQPYREDGVRHVVTDAHACGYTHPVIPRCDDEGTYVDQGAHSHDQRLYNGSYFSFAPPLHVAEGRAHDPRARIPSRLSAAMIDEQVKRLYGEHRDRSARAATNSAASLHQTDASHNAPNGKSAIHSTCNSRNMSDRNYNSNTDSDVSYPIGSKVSECCHASKARAVSAAAREECTFSPTLSPSTEVMLRHMPHWERHVVTRLTAPRPLHHRNMQDEDAALRPCCANRLTASSSHNCVHKGEGDGHTLLSHRARPAERVYSDRHGRTSSHDDDGRTDSACNKDHEIDTGDCGTSATCTASVGDSGTKGIHVMTQPRAEAFYRRQLGMLAARQHRAAEQRRRDELQEMQHCSFRPRINSHRSTSIRHTKQDTDEEDKCLGRAVPRSYNNKDGKSGANSTRHVSDVSSSNHDNDGSDLADVCRQVTGVQEFIQRQCDARRRRDETARRVREIGKGKPLNGPGYTILTPFHLGTERQQQRPRRSHRARPDDLLSATSEMSRSSSAETQRNVGDEESKNRSDRACDLSQPAPFHVDASDIHWLSSRLSRESPP